MMAADSLARSICIPIAAALAIGGFDPDDEPGVDDGVAGAVIAG
jgi:hypothetical protein